MGIARLHRGRHVQDRQERRLHRVPQAVRGHPRLVDALGDREETLRHQFELRHVVRNRREVGRAVGERRLPGLDGPGLERREHGTLPGDVVEVGRAQPRPPALQEVVALDGVVAAYPCQPVVHLAGVEQSPLVGEDSVGTLPGRRPLGLQELHGADGLHGKRAERRDRSAHVGRRVALTRRDLPAADAPVHGERVRPVGGGRLGGGRVQHGHLTHRVRAQLDLLGPSRIRRALPAHSGV